MTEKQPFAPGRGGHRAGTRGLGLRLRLVLAAAVLAASGSGAARAGPGDATHPASLNAPGQRVDVKKSLVPGKRTVVDFWAVWCGSCGTWKKKIDAAAPHMRDTVVLYVDVGEDLDTPVAKQYGITELPAFHVYDGKGALERQGNDAYQWFWAELNRHPGARSTGSP